MADVRELGIESKSMVKLSEDVIQALNLLTERFVMGKPKELLVTQTERPFLLFKDGAFEPGQQPGNADMSEATVGGVLFDPNGKLMFLAAM